MPEQTYCVKNILHTEQKRPPLQPQRRPGTQPLKPRPASRRVVERLIERIKSR